MEVASSDTSEYNSSSDDESSTVSREELAAPAASASRAKAASATRTEDGDEEQDVTDTDDDSSSEEEEEEDDDDGDSQEAGTDDDDDDDDVSSRSRDAESDEDDETRLPLAERIKRQEEQGVNLKDRRERKQRAIQVASERLARVKRDKSTVANIVPKRKKGERSKHAPTEASSKRADFYRRKLDLNANGIGVDINAHRYKPRDPRINNLNGHLDIEHFETNFGFLQEMRQTEVLQLKKRISARKKTGRTGQERRRRLGITNDGGSLEQDQAALKQLLREKAEFERGQVDRAVKRAVKSKMIGANSSNSNLYIPKRKELKRLQLEAKYEELHKRGGDKAIDRAVAKRRKKNKSKDAGMLGGRAQNV